MNAEITFINLSEEIRTNDVCFYQSPEQQASIAWKVVQQCAREWSHPFVFSLEHQICINDAFGNFSPVLSAHSGSAFQVVRHQSGSQLQSIPGAVDPRTIQVFNQQKQGSIGVNLLNAKRCIARFSHVPPQSKAVFRPSKRLFAAVCNGVREGQPIRQADLFGKPQCFDLHGIAKAAIVLLDGGPGPKSKPCRFVLDHIEYL